MGMIASNDTMCTSADAKQAHNMGRERPNVPTLLSSLLLRPSIYSIMAFIYSIPLRRCIRNSHSNPLLTYTNPASPILQALCTALSYTGN